MLARAGERAGVARRGRRGEALLRAGGGADGGPVGASRAARAARARWRGRAGRSRRGARAASRSRSSSTSSRATRTRPPGRLAMLGEARRVHRPARRGARQRMERAFAVISGDEPDEGLAMLAARLSRGVLVQRRSRPCGRAGRVRPRHRRGPASTRASSRWRCAAKAAVVFSRGHSAGGERARSGRRCGSRSTTSSLEDAGICYFLLSDGCFRRDEYTEALGYLDEALALSRKIGDRPYEWASLAERTYRAVHARSLGRGAGGSEEFTAEQIEAGGVMLSLLQTGVEIHVQRGRARRGAPGLRDVRAARGVDRRPGPDRLPRRRAPACAGRKAGCGRRSPTARRRSRRARPSASRSRL